jgi:histidine triad (HIT) family protein
MPTPDSQTMDCIFCAIIRGDAPAAGQEVAHVHIHLIPRRAHDGFGFRFPPGYGAEPDRAELETIAAQIRPGLAPLDAAETSDR